MLEMMSDAPTIAGKHFTSNISCMHSKRYAKYLVFLLAQMPLCVMAVRSLMLSIGPNVDFRWSNHRVVDTSINAVKPFYCFAVEDRGQQCVFC